MTISVIVATRNRSHAIIGCLESIERSLTAAMPIQAEIVVVDNGSTDNTSELVKGWRSGFPVQLIYERRTGQSRARNTALEHAKGRLIAFTDDDCRLSESYISELLRYDEKDGSDLVIRGGRVELGDPTDLPLTIRTENIGLRLHKSLNSSRSLRMGEQIVGCNMTMRRDLVDLVGRFDERFGYGRLIPTGEDTDYMYRAYLAGAYVEYVPDMTVYHFHGRKEKAVGFRLMRIYLMSFGALGAKYFFRHFNFIRPVWWDAKNVVHEVVSGTNTCFESIGFSHKHKVFYTIVGFARYACLGWYQRP